MPNTIKIKNSGTASAVPSSLEYGELGLNYADGKLFYKNLSNAIVQLGGVSTTLDGLSDVVITTPSEFQSLIYDGTNWVNNYSSTVTYVRNAESNTITTGTVVYLFGATGDHASVKRADYGSDTTSSKTIGLVGANIDASQNGPIVTRGYVDGIDLSVGYSSGDILWLGANGAFTKVKPTAPNHLVFIGVVVRATNNGIVYVATQNGYELDELHNVAASSPNSGDFLKYNGTLWVNDAIDLGTDTVGDYVASLVAGTGITLTNNSGEGATPTIAIGQSIGTTDNPTFAGLTADSVRIGITAANEIDTSAGNLIIDSTGGTVTIDDNLIVSGDLTINGTTTTVNTATLNVSDNIVVLNNDVTGTPTENAGIEVERGTSTNVLIRWNETNDKWETTNDGTTYGNIVTTADSGSVTSTMIADGAIVNGDINASAAIEHTKLANITAGSVLLGNASNVPTATALSGDITVNSSGVTAIGSGVIVNADVNASAAIAHSKLANASAGQVLMGTTTTGVVTATTISGDISITGAGVTAIAAGAVVDADINASAAITHSKLANITAGSVLMGNATNVPTATAISGDVTITSAGVTAIASNTIVNADINTGAAIALSKLASGSSAQVVVANATGVPTYTTISGDVTISNTGVATIAANSVVLGTDTTGDYVSSLVAGTGITIANNSGESATPTISIGQAVGTSSNVQFNDLIVSGNLTVNGTTTTINSTTISVDDINIELGSVATPTDVTAAGGGITLKGATDKTITWGATNGWTSSEDINIALGKIYRINGTSVLSATTLGSGVTGSSLTSVGTIGTGVWQGTVIGSTYGGTGVNNGSNTITLSGNLTTSGAFPLTLTTTASTNVTLPTSGTLVNTSVATLSSLASIGTITTGTWNGSVISSTYGGTGVNNGGRTITVNTGNLTLTAQAAGSSVTVPASGTLATTGDTTYVGTTAITLSRASANLALTGISSVTFPGSTSGTIQLLANATAGTGTVVTIPNTTGTLITSGDTGTVTSTMIADGTIVNGDINASAAIAHSKLANASAGQILLGTTTTGVVTATTVSGDVTINGAGVTAIGSGVIVNADINASAAISLSKLASGSSAQVILGNATGVPTYTTVSGDVTIGNTGVTAITANTIVNADINTSAAIAYSKLATATPGQLLLATTTSGIITATTVSGDVTLSSAGVTTISANATALRNNEIKFIMEVI